MAPKYFETVKDARGALGLDTGFDPFLSGGLGRCTKEKLAEAGYVVDPVLHARQRKAIADAAEQRRDRESQERRDAAEWARTPIKRKYAAAARLIGGGSSSMTEIGDNIAHVRNDRGVCVCELIDGVWVARHPHQGERLYV